MKIFKINLLILTKILEALLCEDSEEVAVYIACYVYQQLISKINHGDCMIMRASEINTAVGLSLSSVSQAFLGTDPYLQIFFSRTPILCHINFLPNQPGKIIQTQK